MSPVIKDQGYSPGPDADKSGRTARPPEQGLGRGRKTPDKRQMPFARHIKIRTLIGEGSSSTDTTGARTALEAEFETWKAAPAAIRYKVLEMRFEFVTEGKMALHIIYADR